MIGWEIVKRGHCKILMLSRFSHAQLYTTPWTIARQAPLSIGILQGRILE